MTGGHIETTTTGRVHFKLTSSVKAGMATKRTNSSALPEGKKAKMKPQGSVKTTSVVATTGFKQPNINVTGKCWARVASTGRQCMAACSRDDGIPYCPLHFAKGDGAVEAVDHDVCPEIFGKVLIARHDLPKGYKFVYWGDLLRNSEIPKAAHDHMIEFAPNPYTLQTRGTINPCAHPESSLLQYAMMPGPGEVVNMTPTWKHFGRCGKARTPLAARVYKLTRDVPKGQQIAHDYGKQWMEMRGIRRMNCGTSKYPMPKRAAPTAAAAKGAAAAKVPLDASSGACANQAIDLL